MFCPDERNYLITGQTSRITALTPDFFWSCREKKNLPVLIIEDDTIYKAKLCPFGF